MAVYSHTSIPARYTILSISASKHQQTSSQSVSFWKQLLAIYLDDIQYDTDIIAATNNNSNSSNSSIKDARHEFMLQAYKSSLPAVKWLPLDIDRTFPGEHIL